MAAGFEFYNEAGFKIADQNSYLLQLYATGTAITNEEQPLFTNTGTTGIQISVPVSLQGVLFAFSSSIAVSKIQSYVSGANVVHEFITDMEFPGQPIPYYVFAASRSFISPVTQGPCFELYDESGQVTLSATHGFANVVAVLSTVGSVPVPSGKQYAAAMGSFAGQRHQTPVGEPASSWLQNSWLYGAYGFRSGTAGFNFYKIQDNITSSQAPNYDISLNYGIIIDVTPFA